MYYLYVIPFFSHSAKCFENSESIYIILPIPLDVHPHFLSYLVKEINKRRVSRDKQTVQAGECLDSTPAKEGGVSNLQACLVASMKSPEACLIKRPISDCCLLCFRLLF